MTSPDNFEYAIDINGLNKFFGDKHVVNDVSMRVRRGEIFGFLGPNGSGKTTTIRMMCGLLKPDSGSGTCLGYDILQDSAEIKRNVGYMTQRFSFWDDLTINENLDFVARLYDIPNRRDAVRQTISDLGLAARASQLAGELSGGSKQRMALAACMLHNPKLLLFDEPTAGVDPKARRDFWEQLQVLAANGISVLVSTHYMGNCAAELDDLGDLRSRFNPVTGFASRTAWRRPNRRSLVLATCRKRYTRAWGLTFGHCSSSPSLS